MLGSLKSMGICKKLSDIFQRAKARKITAKVSPMPADTITERFISAGWLLAQMDLAGGNRAYKYVQGRAVTVGLEAMEFKAPVYIGDNVTIYTEIVRQGRTSLAIRVQAYAERREGGRAEKVTEGTFTFVHIDDNGKPKPIGGNAAEPAQTAAQGKSGRRAKASETQVLNHEPALKQGQELSLRTVPFPRDKNYNGDIFGGWVLARMDEAAALRACKFVGGLAAPVAIDAMTFHRPVSELNEVSFYTEIQKVGKSSVTIKVEAWALREDLKRYEKVTEGSFVYVAIDKNRKPVPITPAP